MMLTALLLGNFALQSPGVSALQSVNFDVDGLTRTALVFKPAVSKTEKPAVYFVFHGLGSNADQASKQFHIERLDPKAMVIYAEAIPAPADQNRLVKTRLSKELNIWQIAPKQYDDRDIHFVQSMLKWADEQGANKTKRYYVGHSNGSGFGWVVLKELGNEFDKFVGLNGGTVLRLDGAPQKSTFIASGTQDRVVPSGSVSRFAATLARHNQCQSGIGSPIKIFEGPNPVYLYEYSGGHMPNGEVYPMLVKFCQTGKPL